jgi:hypothetical protein
MQSHGLLLALVLLAPFTVGYLLPKVSTYFLGPAILVIAAVVLVGFHRLFVPFQSDGSPAGLVVPAMMWAAFLLACICGIVLIVTGRMRIRSKDEPLRRPPTKDQAQMSNSRASLCMFNAALGIAILIAPFIPIYRVLATVDAALIRSLGLFLSWRAQSAVNGEAVSESEA